MSVGKRIMELRKDMGYTRNEFAEFIGIPSTTLRNYELGTREPGHPFLIQMAYIFNVSTDYLLCLTDDKSPIYCNSDLAIFDKDEIVVIKQIHNLNNNDKKIIFDLVSRLSEQQTHKSIEQEERRYESEYALDTPITYPKTDYLTGLSAGNGLYVFDDIPTQVIQVPAKYKDADFVIGVSGNSMNPTFKDGDKVAVKKAQAINVGEIGVFMIDGNGYIKELGNGKLISHNKEYDDILLKTHQNIKCIGKVIGKV